jgi:uncharacterized protein YggE
MYQQLNEKQKRQFFGAILGVLGLLTIFLIVQSVNSIKQFSYIGRDVNPTNAISVTGTGFVVAIPDTATFSYSVNEKGKTVAEAQDKSAQKSNAILAALKDFGIDEKDIQTVSYNSYPNYEWRNASCPSAVSASISTDGVSSPVYCPPGKQILTGYEVDQTVTVKIRKTDDAGTVLTKVGSLGATNISGLSFVVDNTDALQVEARDKAIVDAKAKAAALSKSLGVKMTKIINFYENGSNPYPVYSMSSDMVNAKAAGVVSAVPELSTGQSKITSTVTITYELQ